MLSRLVIAFLPRSKCLLISWLQSSTAVTTIALLISYTPIQNKKFKKMTETQLLIKIRNWNTKK